MYLTSTLFIDIERARQSLSLLTNLSYMFLYFNCSWHTYPKLGRCAVKQQTNKQTLLVYIYIYSKGWLACPQASFVNVKSRHYQAKVQSQLHDLS